MLCSLVLLQCNNTLALSHLVFYSVTFLYSWFDCCNKIQFGVFVVNSYKPKAFLQYCCFVSSQLAVGKVNDTFGSVLDVLIERDNLFSLQIRCSFFNDLTRSCFLQLLAFVYQLVHLKSLYSEISSIIRCKNIPIRL